MEHSDYKLLTGLLDSIIAGADLLHWANNEGRHFFEDGDIPGVFHYPEYVRFLNRWWGADIPLDLFQQTVFDPDKDVNTLNIIPRLKTAFQTMCCCENDFVKENQDRADNQLGPTLDFVSLYRTISMYLSGHEIENDDRWDFLIREKLQEWLTLANGWFPDLNDQVGNQEPADRAVTSTPATITIDREKLIECFTGGFKIPDRITGAVPFDGFHDEFVKRATTYTTTDIARVAHQVHQSKFALARIKRMNFSKWLRAFCGMCGVSVPADTSPSRYKTKTPATDFSAWLE